MLVRDRDDFIEILLVERTPSSRPGAGDLRLHVRVAFSTFRGEYDKIWVEAAAFAAFFSELEALETRRRGSATLGSMSPDEFILDIHSTGAAGHIAISGQLGRLCFLGDGGWSLCLIPFNLALPCTSLLPQLLAEFRSWNDSG